MQPPLTYSWIALTASAPVILLLTCWTLAVFHCRRRLWTTMDIFLVSILSQSIIQQFLGFIYSTIVLLKPSSSLTGEAVCTGMMWFFISIPIFKGTTITSLAVDRWLYYTRFSYRLSIRKTHIRYHIAVLAILSCTVGFTALITFNNPELLTTSTHPWGSSQYSFDQCTFLPFKFDLKFVIFYLSVHCIIILVGTTVLCKATCHNKNNGNNSQLLPSTKKDHYKRRRRSSPMDLTPTLSNTSTASSSISNSSPTAFFSTPGLTAKAVLSSSPNHASHQLRNQTRQDFHERSRNEDGTNYRLASALGLLVLTIICTHLPFTIGTVLSRLGIVVPIFNSGSGHYEEQLSIFTWPVTNIVLWLQVIEGLATLLILLIVDDIVPGWIFNRATKAVSRHASKIPHSQIIDAPITKAETSFLPSSSTELNNRSSIKNHYTNPTFIPDLKSNNKFPITNGSLFVGLPLGSNARPALPQESRMTSDDRFFCAVNGNNAVCRQPRNDFDTVERTFIQDDSEYDKKSYHHRYSSVASVTTVANDDFEYHHSRPAVIERPTPTPPQKDGYNPATYVLSQHRRPFHIKKSAEKEKQPKPHLYKQFETANHPMVPRTPRGLSDQPTSLSMNDLDLIDDIEPCPKQRRQSATTKPIISVSSTDHYEHKQRMYRKRTRIHGQNGQLGKAIDHRGSHKPTESSGEMSHRRVLSMECLSPGINQTDHRNFLDISYLDTGDILVRKADSSKCIFVTDFI